MRKLTLLLSVITISFTMSYCDITENRWLNIENDSKYSITCFITTNELNSKENLYRHGVSINKKEKRTLTPGKTSWESYIEKSDGKKLRLYIISTDSIKKYGRELVFKKNIYLKKYYFTMKDLEKIKFQIIYKPDRSDVQ